LTDLRRRGELTFTWLLSYPGQEGYSYSGGSLGGYVGGYQDPYYPDPYMGGYGGAGYGYGGMAGGWDPRCVVEKRSEERRSS